MGWRAKLYARAPAFIAIITMFFPTIKLNARQQPNVVKVIIIIITETMCRSNFMCNSQKVSTFNASIAHSQCTEYVVVLAYTIESKQQIDYANFMFNTIHLAFRDH